MVGLNNKKDVTKVMMLLVIIPILFFAIITQAKEPVIHENPENITEEDSDIFLILALEQVEFLSMTAYSLGEEDVDRAMTNFDGFQSAFSRYDELALNSNLSIGEYAVLHRGFKITNSSLSATLPLIERFYIGNEEIQELFAQGIDEKTILKALQMRKDFKNISFNLETLSKDEAIYDMLFQTTMFDDEKLAVILPQLLKTQANLIDEEEWLEEHVFEDTSQSIFAEPIDGDIIIRGLVVDEKQIAISDIPLQLFVNDELFLEVRTDEKGIYEVLYIIKPKINEYRFQTLYDPIEEP